MTPHPEHRGDDLVTLVQTPGVIEARAIVAMLADEGIPAFAIEPSALDIAVSNARRSMNTVVRVRSEQLEQARAALDEARAAAHNTDWDSLDVGPETPRESTPLAGRVVMWAGFGLAVGLIGIMLIVAIIMAVS